MKKITAIIQARTGSSRLPGKTLMNIKGVSLLGHLCKRIKLSKFINEIIIATTIHERDNDIVRFAGNNNIKFYRGSEDDVLDRFYKASSKYKVETIVRVTPDCPMLDPRVMDSVISRFLCGKYDFVSNTIPPTYPDGLDTEAFSFETLQRVWKEAKLPSDREHVTAYIINRPDSFRLFNVENGGEDISMMRWTVDYKEDFEFINEIFTRLNMSDDIFYMEDVIRLLENSPGIIKLNNSHTRNEGYRFSLRKDKDN
jgi:spore coat polysaccharide biosynthesis protein SpsF